MFCAYVLLDLLFVSESQPAKMYTYTTVVYQRTNMFGGGINEISLGRSDEDKNKLIKIIMLFVIDTDSDSGRNLDGWLNESLFGLDML